MKRPRGQCRGRTGQSPATDQPRRRQRLRRQLPPHECASRHVPHLDGRWPGNYWHGVIGTSDGTVLDRSYAPTDPVDESLHRIDGIVTLARAPAADGIKAFEGAVSGLRTESVVDTAPRCEPAIPSCLSRPTGKRRTATASRRLRVGSAGRRPSGCIPEPHCVARDELIRYLIEHMSVPLLEVYYTVPAHPSTGSKKYCTTATTPVTSHERVVLER